MKVLLKKSIVGYRREISEETIRWSAPRVHADEGDVLPVIFNNQTHYICDSKHFPNIHIAVFPSQCSEIIPEEDRIDEHKEERYYNVYEDSKDTNIDDPFCTAFDIEDAE
jgi:hypothetical protein